MKQTFGKTICEIARADDSLVLLTGDVEQAMEQFKAEFPKRFFNLGICEQSITSLASGMAIDGLFPVVYSITPFLIKRPFEQVWLDINKQNVKVMLVGFADYPHYGPSHNCEDITDVMKLFPNIASYFPGNHEQVSRDMHTASRLNGPSFVSLKKYNGAQ